MVTPSTQLDVHPSGKAIAAARVGVDALRTVRSALINLAYALDDHPRAVAYLVLINPRVTYERLQEEWRRAQQVLKPEVLARLSICLIGHDVDMQAIPREPTPDVRRWLQELSEKDLGSSLVRAGRIDFEFVIVKLLLHQWLIHRRFVTLTWLARAAGCSYPTVARVLKGLGGLIERGSDRSVSLRYFPRELFDALLAKAPRARATVLFVDRSGRPRGANAHVSRLEKLRPPDLALGGALGARHHYPALDLVGVPRLDLSVHAYDAPPDVSFVKAMDPALVLEEDPQAAANVAVHAVRHAEPLFAPRKGGLFWADPIECLLDLYEAKLEAQATQFLDHLKKGRSEADGR